MSSRGAPARLRAMSRLRALGGPLALLAAVGLWQGLWLTGLPDFVLSPVDGAVQGTLDVQLGQNALTYACARGTLFVRIGDERQVAEVSLTGTVLNTISIPDNVTGLGFSSARGVHSTVLATP